MLILWIQRASIHPYFLSPSSKPHLLTTYCMSSFDQEVSKHKHDFLVSSKSINAVSPCSKGPNETHSNDYPSMLAILQADLE